jgi:hypothetical protein
MVPSVADRGGGAVEAGVGGLVEEEGGDVGAGDAGADLVAAEEAGRTVSVRAPSVGRVKRAIVQLSGLSITSCDISSSSR